MNTTTTNNHVQIELSLTTIQRLLGEHRLAGEELRCLNRQSKDSIQKLFLRNLSRSE